MERVSRAAAGRRARPPAVASYPPSRPSRGVVVTVLVAFWALWALLYANITYLSMLEHHHSWWRLVAWQLVNWLAWAALTPLVLFLLRRVPVEPRWQRWPAIVFHVGTGVVVALVHLVPFAFATAYLKPYDEMTTSLPVTLTYIASLGSWFRLDVVVYWGIVAVATAWKAFRRAREREQRAAELEGMLARERLELLRLQLEPHFLFNTLHTATGLVRQRDGDAAVRVLVRLGDLLREVLQRSGDQTVPLSDELALLDGYLEIQQVRFPDLVVERRLEPASLAAEVPSFILQPLLENAVEHGVAGAGCEHWVRLASRVDDGRLEVVVENPAPAAAPEGGAGLGLANCRRRLEALYGTAAEIRLERLDGGTVRVSLCLPAGGPAQAPGASPAERVPT